MSKAKNLSTKVIIKDNDSPWIKIVITEKLRAKIDEFTKHLSESNYPYDTLCWALAEFQMIFEKGRKKYLESEVIKREKKIFDVLLDYEELCWLIANLKVYLEEVKLYP
jgi:hypothetical protein